MCKLENYIKRVKAQLTSSDLIAFEFSSVGGKNFAVVYLDGVADKKVLGELVIAPLKQVEKGDAEEIIKRVACAEVSMCQDMPDAIAKIANGEAVVFIEGEQKFFSVGVQNPPGRAVAEPPTQVTVKGPREGFTEDIKVNLGLVRKRIKSANLQVDSLICGKQSSSTVAICYLKGIADERIVDEVTKNIQAKSMDIIADSSYISAFISKKPRSLFKRCATSEKPDAFCAKLCEGRVGVIVDGSPIALTVPYMIGEDFQSAEDYYITSYRATIIRLIRFVAVMVGIFLPAIYICAQLFKIEIIPVKLLFKIASSVSGIPLSPSVEMFLTLFVLEVLIEASIRMPKYVGLAMSVVGALVLGDTAVKAGIISTPAIIIVAFSAICLYTVPDLIETTTTLRLLFLIVAGSIGTYGIIIFVAFLLCYLVSEQDYGTPLMAPFSPLIKKDLSDGLFKANVFSLGSRPQVFKPKNKVRLQINDQHDKR